jgi:hypothetical protein
MKLWRPRLKSGPRRSARISRRCAIRRRAAVGWGHDSTGPRSRSARGCTRGDDRSTRRWPTERVPCGRQSWRCAHGSSSPAVAGGCWQPVSSGSSRRQSERLLPAPSPYRSRDRRSSKRKRAYSASRPVYATNDRCMREGWRCCRGCSAMAGGPRTTRVREARCATRSERSPWRLTVNGVRDGRRDLRTVLVRPVALGYQLAQLRCISAHRRLAKWAVGSTGLPPGWAGPRTSPSEELSAWSTCA